MDGNEIVPVPPAEPGAGPLDEDYDNALKEALDSDEDFKRDLEEINQGLAGPEDEQDPNEGVWSKLGSSLGRGVLKAVKEIPKAVEDLDQALMESASNLKNKLGFNTEGMEPEEKQEFLKWYETSRPKARKFSEDFPTAQPVITEDRINQWLGPARGGAWGFVEGISQFAAGTALLGPLIGGAGLGPAATTILTGGAVDMSVFDPHEERLSNLLQDGPDWLRNPISDLLEAEGDDTAVVGRLKNAGEGFLLGATLDALIFGVKAVRASRKAKAGKITPAQAAAEVTEAAKAAEAPRPDEVAAVTEAPDGKFEVSIPRENPIENLVPEAEGFQRVDRPPADFTPVDSTVVSDGAGGFSGRVKYKVGDKVVFAHFPIRNAADAQRFGELKGENFAFADEALFKEATKQEWFSTVLGGKDSTAKKTASATEGTVSERTPKPSAAPAEAPSGQVLLSWTSKDRKLKDLPPGAPTGKEAMPQPLTFASRAEAEQAAVTYNFAAKNRLKQGGVIDPADVKGWQAAMKEYAEVGDTRTAKELLERYGVNVKYAQAPQDVVNSIKALADLFPTSEVARNKPRSWAESAKAAEDIIEGMSGENLLTRAQQVWGETGNLDAHITALRTWMLAQGQNVARLAKLADANPSNALAMNELRQSLDTLLELQTFMSGTSSNVARALNVHKMPLGDAVQNLLAKQGADPAAKQAAGHRAPESAKSFAGMTNDEIKAFVRAIEMADGDIGVIQKILHGPKMNPKMAANPSMKKKWQDFVLAWRMEALLSGPKTHATNALNNALVALQRPAEFWWAGVRSGDKELKQEGADIMAGLFENWRESWQLAKASFKGGDNILDSGHGSVDGGYKLGASYDVHWLKLMARAPSRLLMTSDEFFKQLNYRAHMRSQILKKARDEGITSADELAKRLKEDMALAFDPTQGAVNPKALEYSRVSTFTNDLGEGTWGESIHTLMRKHYLGRLIAPFIRTPVQIFRYAWQRTPRLNRINKEFRADLAAGGQRAAVARAKTEMGLAAFGTAGILAATGQITGRGPSDPKLRKQWIDVEGNQPYSIKIPGTKRWVSYRRGDPVMAPLGLAADLVEMMGELNETDAATLTSSLIASIASNLTSKTFMQGITDFMDAMSSSRADAVERWLTNLAGSFIPNIGRQMDPNDTFRETRGFFDEMANRIPGLSQTLEPRRNLFGEKVMKAPGYFNQSMNPFTASRPVKDNDVARELLKLGKAMPMPAETVEDGLINLADRELYGQDRDGQSPYDRLLELMGERIGGAPPLKEMLERVVQSDSYQRLPDSDAAGDGGLRFETIRTLVINRQRAAFGAVLREYPSLKKAIEQAKEVRGVGKARGHGASQDTLQGYEELFIRQ